MESDPVYQAEKAKRMENMPKVAVLYVNNAETTYNDEVDGVVLGNLENASMMINIFISMVNHISKS